MKIGKDEISNLEIGLIVLNVFLLVWIYKLRLDKEKYDVKAVKSGIQGQPDTYDTGGYQSVSQYEYENDPILNPYKGGRRGRPAMTQTNEPTPLDGLTPLYYNPSDPIEWENTCKRENKKPFCWNQDRTDKKSPSCDINNNCKCNDKEYQYWGCA